MNPLSEFARFVSDRTEWIADRWNKATGGQPELAFSGNTTAVIFDAILHSAPAPPVSLNPKLPTDVEYIILRCLRKSREERYASVSELEQQLVGSGNPDLLRVCCRLAGLYVEA